MSAAAIAQVRAAEDERCHALVENDLRTIATSARDDIVHGHATGKIDDKAIYLEGLASRIRFERADREDLSVRVCGNTAIATGMLHQTIVNRMSGTASRVFSRRPRAGHAKMAHGLRRGSRQSPADGHPQAARRAK